MGGKAARRRAKLMQAANEGNLHKAAKGKASASLPLPAAPTKDDYVEKVPASLRRLMALRKAMDRPKKTPSGDGAGKAVRLMADRVVMQQDACGTKATGQQQERAANVQQDSAHSKAVQNVAPGALWEQPRRLKQRRKEYLKAKQLKKKRKGRAPADQDMETVLHTDMPAFGEVVHAPPTVQLKRKHWDPAAGAAQEQEQHQQQQQTRQKQKQQQQRMHAKKPHHGQQSPDEELVQMREALIEGYRAGRAPREGQATLASLKQLAQGRAGV